MNDINKLGKMLAGPLDALAPGIGTASGVLLGLLDNLATPSDYKPVKYNENYNTGGTIDKQLSSMDLKVQGKSGRDTNARQILGNNVNLTKGETITATPLGAEVFSDAPEMKHPLAPMMTFAEVAEPIQRSTGKAEKVLRKFPEDRISKNTIKANQGILEADAARQDLERTKNTSQDLAKALTGLNRYMGGKINNYYLGTNDPITDPAKLTTDNPITLGNTSLSFNPIQFPTKTNIGDQWTVASTLGTPSTSLTTSLVNNLGKGANNVITTAAKAGDIPEENTKITNTVGDYIYAGAKSLETLGRISRALDSPEQFATDRYNVDPIKLSAQDQLDANNRSYRGALSTARTGNANVDRATTNALFAQKIQADNTARRELRNAQTQINLDVSRNNASQRAVIDQINSQTQGLKNQTIDAALTSVGTLGNIFMDMYNSRTNNQLTVDSLNALSRYYDIDTEKLVDIMKNNPEQFDKMLYKFNAKKTN